MEAQLIEKKQDSVKFMIKGINTSIANAIRRNSQEIPVLAIDEVEFIKNDSALFDEILAHRLGLVPLKTEKGMELREECSCEGKGCSKCTVSLKLSAEGPAVVFSSSLKGKAEVVYGKMPLVDLIQGQELEFNAYARLGKGIEHAKFSAGIISYLPEPIITVNNKSPKLNQFKEKYPKKIFKNGEIVKELIKDELADSCEGICEEVVKVSYSDENFIFYVESFGHLSARDLFLESCKALGENLKALGKAADKI